MRPLANRLKRLMLLIATITLMLGSGVTEATTQITDTAPVEGAAGGAGGVSAPMNPANLALSAESVSATPRTVARGSEFSSSELVSLKDQASRGALGRVPAGQSDTASILASAPSAPTQDNQFDAFTYTNWIPSDGAVAAGPSDIVASVNESVKVMSKTGTTLTSSTLVTWFANVLPSGYSVFDPKVIYDNQSGRFVVVAFATRTSDSTSRMLVSVSDNNVAQGNWCNFSMNAKTNGNTATSFWADYPGVGLNPDAVIVSANMFTFGSSGTFQYAKVRFLPKGTFYNSSCPTPSWYDFWSLKNSSGSNAFTVSPAHSEFFSNGSLPHTTYLVNSTSSGSGSSLSLWKAGTPGQTFTSPPTLTRQSTISVNSYTLPPAASQKGSSTKLDTGDARILSAVLRSNGVWASQSTGCTISGDTTTRACLRWYQLSYSANSVTQQGTFGGSGSYYFFPAIAADAKGPNGNAVIAFHRSSTSEFASFRYTGRLSTDTLNALQGSSQLIAGQGCYVRLDSGGENRWGDYNGIGIDPANGHFWILGEYAHGTSATCSSNNWSARVGQVHY